MTARLLLFLWAPVSRAPLFVGEGRDKGVLAGETGHVQMKCRGNADEIQMYIEVLRGKGDV